MADVPKEKLDICKSHYKYFRSRAAEFLWFYRKTKDDVYYLLYDRNKWYADGFAMGLSIGFGIGEKTLKK